jgi:zinc transporter ZupT
MNQIATTSVFSFILLLVALISGVTGYKIQNSHSDYLSYLNALAAGVILAAAFTHLLADANEDLAHYSYPFAPACALAGFLLLVVVETVLSYNITPPECSHLHPQGSDAPDDVEMGCGHQQARVPSTVFPIRTESIVRAANHGRSINCDCAGPQFLPDGGTMTPGSMSLDNSHHYIPTEVGPPTEEHNHDHEHEHEHDHNTCAASHNHSDDTVTHDIALPLQTKSLFQSSPPSVTSEKIIPSAGAYSFWLALVVHSVMEGFAVGVSGNFVQQLAIVLAIVVHKIFASMALTTALIDSQQSNNTFFCLYGIYAIASPAGAIVAAMLTIGDSSTVPGIITGLAAGSFM